jgi:transglutaminase-like putative cysteine protease
MDTESSDQRERFGRNLHVGQAFDHRLLSSQGSVCCFPRHLIRPCAVLKTPLARLAKREFNQDDSGFYRVTRICNWIFERVEYLSGKTTATTSAFDMVTELAGVCRDFAHLAIAFCRSLGIPARFVSAYAYGLNPPDFHAYIEAFLGGRWILFDPTRLAPQSSFVRIGQGRDAADTSFATIFGGAVMNKLELSMQPSTGQRNYPEYTTAPISNYPSPGQSEK